MAAERGGGEIVEPGEEHGSNRDINDALEAQEKAQEAAKNAIDSILDPNKPIDSAKILDILNNAYIDEVTKTNPEVADIMKKIVDTLDPSKGGDPEAFKKAIEDANEKQKKPLPGNLTPEEVEKFNKYNRDILQDSLDKINKTSEQIKELLKKYPIEAMKDPTDSNTFKRNVENINKIADEMNYKELEKNAKDRKLDKIKKDGIDPAKDKPSWTDSIKKNLKWLLLLLGVLGAGIVGIQALIIYAEFHSGCQYIKCDKDELPVSTKIWCFGSQKYDEDGIPKSYDVFLPGNDNLYDYNSAQCMCASPLTATVKDCSGSEIEQGKKAPNQDCCKNNSANEYPSVLAANNPSCNGDINIGAPYAYYYWGIMSPLDAAGNIGNGVQNYTQHGFKWLVKLLVIVGVVVGVIILLLIIYQYFKNKHPAQAIKIETGSAISKFGNSSYFGNLSRYSNYAYMGRCAAFPAKPNVPLRFKF